MRKNPFEDCESCNADCVFKQRDLRDNISTISSANTLSYTKGQQIFEAGEPIVGFYVICQGLIKETSNKSAGQNITLRLLKPGDILISDSFLRNHGWYATSAKSLTDTVVLFLEKDVFSKMVQMSHHRMAKEIAKNMRYLRHNIELYYCSVQERTAYWLVNLRQKLSKYLTLTNQDLAEIVGCSSVTISKTLNTLESRGMVYKSRKKLIIRDEDKLRKEATCANFT